MNHIYRLVWNQLSSAWVPAAENAKSRGKSTGICKSGATMLLLLSSGALLTPSAHAANAADAKVTLGNGSVTTVGTTTTINQQSQNMAIDWSKLSTAANEALIFNQPNISAIALNRITGSSPSALLGSLTANGQVFILNPNGVLFGAGAQINVGGLVASTLSMRNADLQAGNTVFGKDAGTTGSVVNQGTINAADGGYIALVGATVRNSGSLNAQLGTVLLAAGDKVTLNLNNGSLLGYSIDQGALNALAENRQLIQANGGQVLMSAKTLNQLTTAVVNNTGIIEAKTVQNKAGRIMLMSDMDSGSVNVGGTLDASAPGSGNGGFIETSAAQVNVASGTKVTTAAASGKTGKWLIDPRDFTIAASGGNMTGADVAATLAGTDFVIQTATMGSTGGNGDINVNDAVAWNAGTTLTLSAGRNININQSITAQNADGKLALEYGQSTVNAGNTATYTIKAPINLQAGNNFSTKRGSDGTTVEYQVITSLGNEGSTTGTDLQGMRGNLAGNYVLGANIDASATAAWENGAGFKPVGVGDSGSYSSAIPVSGANTFSGIFDGLGHTIQNLTINRPADAYVGLFGAASGTLKNVGLTGGSFTGYWRVGALAGGTTGSVSNTYATSNIKGQGQVGGLIGYADETSKVDSSHTAGNVGEVPNIQGWYMGGLVGYGVGTINNSYSSATVAGARSVGGLVGSTDQLSTIRNSYATGTINGSFQRGGLNYGGLVGSNQGLIENSFASGEITVRAQYMGGLTGYNTGTINNSYASGQINLGMGTIGGLVGKNAKNSLGETGTINNSYSTTVIVGGNAWDPSSIGGLVGINDGTVTNSFWNTQTSRISAPSAGVGLTTLQMQQASTFAGWDMATTGGSTSVWRIYDGATLPQLRSFMTALTVTGNNISKTYDGTTTINNGGYTLSDASANSNLIFGTAAYGNTTSKNVGTYSMSVSGLYSNQFGYDISFANGNAVITPAALTVTAQQSTKVYDGTTATGAQASISGPAGTDVIASYGTQVFADKNAGNNKTVSASGVTIKDGDGNDMTGNYSINYVSNTTSAIAKATLNVAATGVDRTYNGTANATVTYSDNRIIGDALIFSANAAFNDKNVGNNKTINISNAGLSGADAGNYTLSLNSSGVAANITPASLTVTAGSASKPYDGIPYAAVNSSTIAGFVNGETIADLSGSLIYGGTAQGATAIGNYTITAGGLSSSNYAVSFINGALVIRPINPVSTAPVTASLGSSYDSALHAIGSNTAAPAQKDERFQLAASDSNRTGNNPSPRLSLTQCGMQLPAGADNAGCQ